MRENKRETRMRESENKIENENKREKENKIERISEGTSSRERE